MIEINFDLPAFLLSLLCLIFCLTAKHRQYVPPKTFNSKLKNQHFVFLCMLIANIVCAATSVASYYLTNATFTGAYYLQYILYVLYFMFHSTLSLMFALYIMDATGMNWKKPGFILFSIPYLVSEILILINSFNHLTFSIDENLVYHRGPLMYVLYGLGLFYVLAGFIFFIINKKAISRNDSIAVCLFIVIGTLGIATQAAFSSLLVELFFEGLACLVLMVVLEEKGGHIDLNTGLLNRISFAEVNKRLIASKTKYIIVLVQLKEVETIIKRFGEREADTLLRHVSEFLLKKSSVKDVYCCRRDSFAVILRDANDDEAMDFANAVLERFNEEWIIDALEINSEVVVTIINIPESIRSFEELDSLISSNYHRNKPGSCFVPIEEVKEITKSSLYERALKKAITENKLALYFQPIWSVKEKRTVSAEALLRVKLDELAGVSPEEYIPIAERTGLIKDIGIFVFEEACLFLSKQKIIDSNIKYVELNLSVYQFLYNDLIETFEQIRKKYGIDASRINLEITETMAALEDNTIKKQLEQFQSLGYTLSLDDFGTGYSNLIRMMNSRYQNIKIDKSILWNITKDGGDPSILMNAVNFIKKQGFDIIQEGVETKEELDLVIKCGCDYVQGFYFNKAITQNEFIDYLNKESMNQGD